MPNDEERAVLAQQILDNPVFTEIFGIIEDEAIRTWMSSPLSAKEEREKLYAYVKFLHKFRGILTGMVGAVALKEAQEKLFTEYEQDEYVNV